MTRCASADIRIGICRSRKRDRRAAPVFPRLGAGAVTEMRVTNLAAGLAALILLSLSSLASAPDCPASPPPQIRVPNRPGKPLFAGEQGRQRTEINYDRKTRIVTLRLVVQDSNGYFIPDIHRENFAVYEDGIRQQNATVEIEHAAVCAGVLVEYGGHYRALNEALAASVSMAVGCQLVVTFPQPCATSCNSQWRSSKAKRDSLLATMNLLADPAAPMRGRARDVDPRQAYLTVLNGQTDGCRWTCALRSYWSIDHGECFDGDNVLNPSYWA
jgi:hypothetical protein